MIPTILLVIITVLLATATSKIKNIENLLEHFYLKSFNDIEYKEEKREKEINTIFVITVITIITLVIIFFRL